METIKRVDIFGNEEWRMPSGGLHREDGPAYVRADGYTKWYLSGQWIYSVDDYFFLLKRLYGKTDEDIMMLRMQYDTN